MIGGYEISDDILAAIIYTAIILLFRKQFSLQQISITTLAKISLMIVSAYFSYYNLNELKLPPLVSIIGGMAFVLGIQQLASLIMGNVVGKHKHKFGKITLGLLIVILVLALLLDISMTGVKLIIGEGKEVIRQNTFTQKLRIEQMRAIQAKSIEEEIKQRTIQNLNQKRQYANARYQASKQVKSIPDSLLNINFENYKAMGSLQTGFTQLLEDKTGGRYATNGIIILISFILSTMIVVMEIIEQVSNASKSANESANKTQVQVQVEPQVIKNSKKKRKTKRKYITPLKTIFTKFKKKVQVRPQGKTQIGFKIASENILHEKIIDEVQAQLNEIADHKRKKLNKTEIAKKYDTSRQNVDYHLAKKFGHRFNEILR